MVPKGKRRGKTHHEVGKFTSEKDILEMGRRVEEQKLWVLDVPKYRIVLLIGRRSWGGGGKCIGRHKKNERLIPGVGNVT